MRERDVRVKDSRQKGKSRSMMRFAQACCVASPSELKFIERDRRFTKASRYSDVDTRIVDFMRMFLFFDKNNLFSCMHICAYILVDSLDPEIPFVYRIQVVQSHVIKESNERRPVSICFDG